MAVDLVPGAALPDVTLADHAGRPRRLSTLAAGDPLVVTFYRGFWCPREQVFFRRLLRLADEAEVAYVRLVSISTEPPPVIAAFRAGLGAQWTFLSDHERVYQAALGLRDRSDILHRPYPPTVLTLSPDLTVHSRYDGSVYWARPTNDQLRADLLAINLAVRPTWDEGDSTPPPSACAAPGPATQPTAAPPSIL
jgi:peroxiredoxin